MNDLDMERRLSEAFDAKAEQLVPSRTTPPPLDLDGPTGTVTPLHRHRRVWIGTGLLAAAAAVVVGALIAVSGSDLSSRPAPITAAQQTTATAPTTDVAPPPVATTPPASAGGATGSAPAAVATHAVTLDGVTVTVPASWQPAPASADSPYECLTVGGVAATSSDAGYSGNCELRWQVATAFEGDPNPDTPGVFGNPPSGCTFVTATADEVPVAGQSAEHRVFTSACFQGAREQWTVLTAPVVVFARDLPATSDADSAAADAAVQDARIPTRTGPLRVDEVGFARTATPSAVEVDRVTFLAGGGGIRDTNPATYRYPLTSAVQITTPNGQVTLDQFVAMVGSGDWSAAGIPGQAYVQVHSDGTTVNRIDVEPVS